MNPYQNKKVVFVIASDGFQQIEYHVPKKFLEEAGIKVITASDKSGGAIAKDKSTTPVDITIDQIHPKDYQGIFFIGGPGALECLDNDKSYHLLAQAKKLHIPYGAICISVRILAKAGVLRGVVATGWNDDHALQTILEGFGATYDARNPMRIDGKVVTAIGPSAALDFGKGILEVVAKEVLA